MSFFGTVGSLVLSGLGKLIGNFIKNGAGKVAQGAGAFGLNYLNSRILNSSLTGAQQEQNAFNAEQAEINRDFQASQSAQQNAFNAEQAQINRDFQAKQAATQWQRGVVDMKAAGLNPALAYGQGGASSMNGVQASSAGLPSGATASGSTSLFPTSLSDLMNLMLLEKQGKMLDAEIQGQHLENEGRSIENVLTATYGASRADAEIRQIEQAVQESIARSGEASTRSALNSAMADLTRVQASNESLKQAELKWRSEFIESWNMPPELAGDLAKAAATLAGAGLMSVGNLLKFFNRPKGTITREVQVPGGKTIFQQEWKR